MELARASAVTALSAVLLTSGSTAATASVASAASVETAASAETRTPTSGNLPATSDTRNGGEISSTQDTSRLTQEQIDNARTVIAVGKGSELSVQAQTIAVMTALQESSLRNLAGGDKDSAGLFQQRHSYGWGTWEQITDRIYASKSFYGINADCANPGLQQIDGWTTMDAGTAAQAVQGSGYPDAYDKWETLAAELVDENQDVSPIA